MYMYIYKHGGARNLHAVAFAVGGVGVLVGGVVQDAHEKEVRGVRERRARVPARQIVNVGGGARIHPENAHMSGRHGVQYVAQCVACATLTLVVWQ